MKQKIVNPYSEATVLNQPVGARPFTREELAALLEQGVSEMFSAKGAKRYEHAYGLTSVRMFRDFLILSKRECVDLNEFLLEEFRTFFKEASQANNGKTYEQKTINKAIDTLRSIINGHFYNNGYVQRKLLCKKPYEKYKPLLDLSEATQNLIVSYENDGRKVNPRTVYYEDPITKKEAPRLVVERRSSQLSAGNRTRNIRNTLRILLLLNKTGLESLTREDLEHLLKIGREQDIECAMAGYIDSLRSVITNGIALGALRNNPFDGFEYEEKRYAPRNDFIMPDQMDKVLNLDTLDWNDFMQVRDRCITLTGYDTALRASTLALLQVNDFLELSSGEYQLKTRGSYLKGQKSDADMALLFNPTIQLLKFWITVARPKLKPKCSSLFISSRGLPLTDTGIRNSVDDCCRLLQVSTHKGFVPTPHTLRHSFATLNIEPYGKSLKTRQMWERLIHVNLETIEKTYIHNNPFAKMEESKKLRQKDSKMGVLGRVAQDDFFAVLDALAFAKPSSISDIKSAYKRAAETKIQLKIHDAMISEDQAADILSPFSIDYRSLRAYGLKNGVCHFEEAKKGQEYFFVKKVIEEIRRDYLPFHEARKMLGIGRQWFYKKIKGCRKISIGNQTLIMKEDLMQIFMENPNPQKIVSKTEQLKSA